MAIGRRPTLSGWAKTEKRVERHPRIGSARVRLPRMSLADSNVPDHSDLYKEHDVCSSVIADCCLFPRMQSEQAS